MDWLHLATIGLSGALGGAVRVAAGVKGDKTWLATVFIGAVTAEYTWPIGTGIVGLVFHPILPVDAVITPEAGAFVIGLCGSLFVGFLIGTVSSFTALGKKGQ